MFYNLPDIPYGKGGSTGREGGGMEEKRSIIQWAGGDKIDDTVGRGTPPLQPGDAQSDGLPYIRRQKAVPMTPRRAAVRPA